jgi:hypothetical protein
MDLFLSGTHQSTASTTVCLSSPREGTNRTYSMMLRYFGKNKKDFVSRKLREDGCFRQDDVITNTNTLTTDIRCSACVGSGSIFRVAFPRSDIALSMLILSHYPLKIFDSVFPIQRGFPDFIGLGVRRIGTFGVDGQFRGSNGPHFSLL